MARLIPERAEGGFGVRHMLRMSGSGRMATQWSNRWHMVGLNGVRGGEPQARIVSGRGEKDDPGTEDDKTGDSRGGDLGDAIRRRSNPAFILAAFSVLLAGNTANADLIAGWSFNGMDSMSAWIEPDHGEAWLDVGSLLPAVDLFAGTTMNAPFEWRAGEALGLQGPVVGSGSILLGIESGPRLVGSTSPVQVSFAARRSQTGFDRVTVESWSDGAWSLVDSIGIDTEWGRYETNPILTDPHSGLLLRMTMDGSTSSQGTVRFDNLRIDSKPIPGPATAALIGVGGLIGTGGGRRR